MGTRYFVGAVGACEGGGSGGGLGGGRQWGLSMCWEGVGACEGPLNPRFTLGNAGV